MILTIVTVVRNDRLGLSRTRASIEAQVSKEFNWLVIDGASTDATLEAIRDFHKVSLRVVSEPDKGIYDAMNKGVQMADGHAIIFLNAGDKLADETTISKIVSDLPLLSETVAGFYGSTRVLRNGVEQKILAKTDPRWVRGAMPATHQAIIFNRTVHLRHLYDLRYRISADYGAVASMYAAGFTFIKRDYMIAIRDGGAAGASATHWKVAIRDAWHVQRDIIGAGLLERTAWALRRASSRFVTRALDKRLLHPALAQRLRGR